MMSQILSQRYMGYRKAKFQREAATACIYVCYVQNEDYRTYFYLLAHLLLFRNSFDIE